jgi:hypothetical protein
MHGRRAVTYGKQSFIFTSANPLLGFWGTATQNIINSLGTVAVNTTCVPPFEPPGSSDDESERAGNIVAIVFGTLLGIALIIAIIVTSIKVFGK